MFSYHQVLEQAQQLPLKGQQELILRLSQNLQLTAEPPLPLLTGLSQTEYYPAIRWRADDL